MLSAEAAGLVISITERPLKLSGRRDLLLAEKEGTTSPLVLPVRKTALPLVPRAQPTIGASDGIMDTNTSNR